MRISSPTAPGNGEPSFATSSCIGAPSGVDVELGHRADVHDPLDAGGQPTGDTIAQEPDPLRAYDDPAPAGRHLARARHQIHAVDAQPASAQVLGVDQVGDAEELGDVGVRRRLRTRRADGRSARCRRPA